MGTDHDLHVLDERVAELEPAAERRRALARTITDRRGEAHPVALRLAERLYAEKPKAYAARLRAYWRAWAGDEG